MASRSSSQVLTDHEEIRRWAEERGARPAAVRATGKGDDVGIIRLDFPGYSGADSLEQISWEDFFEKFDANGLALLVQETTAGGQQSNFNKIVKRETAVSAGGGRSHRGSSRSGGNQQSRSQGGQRSRSSQKGGGSRQRSARTSASGSRAKRASGSSSGSSSGGRPKAASQSQTRSRSSSRTSSSRTRGSSSRASAGSRKNASASSGRRNTRTTAKKRVGGARGGSKKTRVTVEATGDVRVSKKKAA